ncbi:MAG TPA: HAMP domain-containing sensor histidine kinase [Stellaceae bacterium]|nr:HAMP domain-containing sensor histidine kinase [Stellaceae bacterium]
MGSVTAKVARDLRDPLSTIKNSLFLARGEALTETPAVSRALDRIERSADRCNRIISDLIEYSHSSPLRRRVLALDDWLRETAESLGPEMPVIIKLDLRAAAFVELDPGRLRRAIGNILDNAAQALADVGKSTRTARILLRSRVRNGCAEIDIADNGPGIAREILARTFEPLFSTRRYGTGLGLPTARQIVEQHGGTIELTSGVGKGTRARILLPLANSIASFGNSRMPNAA